MAGNETAALVVALSAQLTKFENDMKRAGEIADRGASDIESRFSKINPSFAGTFLGSFLSNLPTQALDSALKLVSELKDRFIDLDATAKLVGVSLQDAFGFQEAASKSKVPVEDATKSIRGLATLLDEMQRGEKNSLSKLFDANPDALKGINRDALTLQQTIGLVADLVQNARTEVQKLEFTRAAGQADSMVGFLEQGGKAVRQLAADAAASAPDLQRLAEQAKAFDDAWNSAVKNVKAYLSEHLFDGIKNDLYDLISLLEKAVGFLSLFKGGPLGSGAESATKYIDGFRKSLQLFSDTQIQAQQRALAGLDDPNAFPKAGASEGQKTGGGTSTRDRNRPLSNVPLKTQDTAAGGNDEDAFDRATRQAEKNIAVLNAETGAIGLNSEARERAKLVASLEEAAKRANSQAGLENTAVTDEQRAKINLLADALEGAAAKSRLANDQLQKINSASATFGAALSSSFADAVVEGKNLNDVFASLIKTLEKAAINSAFASLFNAPTGGGVPPFVSLFSSFLPGRAGGGMITGPGGPTSDSIMARLSDGEFVMNASSTSKFLPLLEAMNSGQMARFAAGGFVGVPSAIAPARGSSSPFQVNIVNNAGAQVQTEQVQDGRGGRSLKVLIDEGVASAMTQPGSQTRRAFGSTFGARPQGVRRG